MSAKLRIILDTNVWLDWLVFGDPAIAPISAAHAANRIEILIDAPCEAELARALAYDLGKRSPDAAAQASCLAECRRVVLRIESLLSEGESAQLLENGRAQLPVCRDADDQKFLEAALAAGADFLITRDRALLELAPRAGGQALPFRIVTPEEFSAG